MYLRKPASYAPEKNVIDGTAYCKSREALRLSLQLAAGV